MALTFPGYLTMAEAGKYLELSPSRIRQLVLAGLPAERFGRILLVRRADLDRFRVRNPVGRPKKNGRSGKS